MKVWTSIEKDDDKVIAFANKTIYKGNPKAEEIDSVVYELGKQDTVPTGLAGFPLSYIREINLTEGSNNIELVFGKDSTEDLKIASELRRREIFEYLKNNIPDSAYTLYKPTAIQAGKKPLIAFVVVLALFIWTLYLALGIESGNDYDVTGQRYNSIAGIVLAIASIGVKNVILVFGALLTIAIISFIKKAKKPPVIDRLLLHQADASAFSLIK